MIKIYCQDKEFIDALDDKDKDKFLESLQDFEDYLNHNLYEAFSADPGKEDPAVSALDAWKKRESKTRKLPLDKWYAKQTKMWSDADKRDREDYLKWKAKKEKPKQD